MFDARRLPFASFGFRALDGMDGMDGMDGLGAILEPGNGQDGGGKADAPDGMDGMDGMDDMDGPADGPSLSPGTDRKAADGPDGTGNVGQIMLEQDAQDVISTLVRPLWVWEPPRSAGVRTATEVQK